MSQTYYNVSKRKQEVTKVPITLKRWCTIKQFKLYELNFEFVIRMKHTLQSQDQSLDLQDRAQIYLQINTSNLLLLVIIIIICISP